MRHVYAFFLLCVLTAPLGLAQETPRGEIFIGYSYLNADLNGSRQSVPSGLNLSFVGNVNPWIGVETNNGTYYKKISGVNTYNYSLLFGPRVHYRWAFLHFLFGMDDNAVRVPASLGGFRGNQASPAAAFGGGATLKLYPHIGVEGSADYAFSHHNSLTQNNFRASAGIVFTFGSAGGGETAPAASPSARRPPLRPTGMTISSLGVVTVPHADNRGAEITDVAPNSAAMLAGMQVGDVVNSVDGTQIKTPMELTDALSGKASGTKVRLGFLIHGAWQTETVVILP